MPLGVVDEDCGSSPPLERDAWPSTGARTQDFTMIDKIGCKGSSTVAKAQLTPDAEAVC